MRRPAYVPADAHRVPFTPTVYRRGRRWLHALVGILVVLLCLGVAIAGGILYATGGPA